MFGAFLFVFVEASFVGVSFVGVCRSSECPHSDNKPHPKSLSKGEGIVRSSMQVNEQSRSSSNVTPTKK